MPTGAKTRRPVLNATVRTLLLEHNPATRRNAEVVRDIHSRMRVIRVDLDPA